MFEIVKYSELNSNLCKAQSSSANKICLAENKKIDVTENSKAVVLVLSDYVLNEKREREEFSDSLKRGKGYEEIKRQFSQFSSIAAKVDALNEILQNKNTQLFHYLKETINTDFDRTQLGLEAVRIGYESIGKILFSEIETLPSAMRAIKELKLAGNEPLVDHIRTTHLRAYSPKIHEIVTRALNSQDLKEVTKIFPYLATSLDKVNVLKQFPDSKIDQLIDSVSKESEKSEIMLEAITSSNEPLAKRFVSKTSYQTKVDALQVAASHGEMCILTFLMGSGIDVNGRSANGTPNPNGTPLMHAVLSGKANTASSLLSRGGQVTDILQGMGQGVWNWTTDTLKGLAELGKLLGESVVSLPNNLKVVTSAIEREIAEAKANPDKKLNEVSQGLANLYIKLGHFPETDKLAKSLSDWLETTPLDAQVAQATYAGLEVATFGVGTIGKKFPRVVKEIDDVSVSATGKTSLSEYAARNRVEFEKYKDNLASLMQKPHVQDPKLSEFFNGLYRSDAKIGSGSTADAVRYERKTGNPVAGKYHEQKAYDALAYLEKWLKNNPAASSGDKSAAENVIRDLKNALAGK